MTFINNIKAWWSSKFYQWVSRRNPPSNTKRLTQKNVFIFPTKEGGFFSLLLLLLLLTAINYQNSLIYIFTFLLGSLFVFSIIFCFKNMSGLSLSLVKTSECFVGESAEFSFSLKTKENQDIESLRFTLVNEPEKIIDIADSEVVSLNLTIKALKRGTINLGRLRLETVYPLGLIRAWTWLEFKKEALVFPKPVEGTRNLSASSQGDEDEGGVVVKGEDELSGIRDYVQGDSLSRIAWKHYASKGELYVKEFDAVSSSTQWLKYNDYLTGDKELRLSNLCFDVLSYAQKGLQFGLELPGTTIEPSQGEAHKLICLRALAIA
jgi:uncharacterized protein (DUF58 family)